MTESRDTRVAEILREPSVGSRRKYAMLTTGRDSAAALVVYDLVTGLFSSWPGGLGFLLRRMFLRFVLGHVGRRVTVGCGVTFRGSARVSIGNHVSIDRNCTVDARGEEARIEIGDGVLIACNTIVRSRGEVLSLGPGSDIGSNCILGTDSRLTIGRDVLIGAYTYLAAGGSHACDDLETPIIRQGCVSKGGITIGDGAWLGGQVMVLDGVNIGKGAVVGAKSLVTCDLPDNSISFGSPATVRRFRGDV